MTGTIALAMGILFTIGGFTEEESNLTSWFGGFAGFILIGEAAVMYMAALLAYIAHLVASAVDRQWTVRREVIPPSAPILSEIPRPPWYAQEGVTPHPLGRPVPK